MAGQETEDNPLHEAQKEAQSLIHYKTELQSMLNRATRHEHSEALV